MDIPRHIFKAYDIRGIIDKEVTPELAEMVGKALATLLSQEVSGDLTVAVGRDMRESSLELQEHLMKGLVDSGVDVKDIGLVSAPAFYFGVGHTGASGGVMVSASHNPAEYNGFKLTRANAVPVSGDTGIQTIADIIERGEFVSSDKKGAVEKVGDIPARTVKQELNFAGEHPIKPFKIVADSANGMGAQYLDELFNHINVEAVRMYWEFDGSFPNHEADPLKEENLSDLAQRVKEENADVGVATDGDGDRLFFVDDKGAIVLSHVLRGLLAQIVLRDYPGATIAYDIRPGKITVDMIEEAGGKPVVTRVGHSLIKDKMLEVDAVFGGESSGHFFFKFPNGTYEGPVVVCMMLLQEMTRQDKPLSEIVEPFSKRYAHSGEINFAVADKAAAISALKEKYADGEFIEIDGVTITFDNYWFNVRASNTENKLRLNLEAIDRATMEKKRDEIAEFLQSLA